VLAIMGSGETAPAMNRVHRELLALLPADAPAVILDTTYGFQENADDITERMVESFRVSLGRDFGVASYRRRDVDPLAAATALARVVEAGYLLAGPGSPSYALQHWAGGPIAGALAAKLADGGIVTMASAAALTLGVLTVPVYEIYKVGADPEWLPGLNLLEAATGLRAAVIPHYDNAEGGNHDTRFCYLGERRLRILEAAMPAEAFVLGVDSHTALVLDLDGRTGRVAGLGGVTVRRDGRSVVLPAGSAVTIDDLRAAAQEAARGPRLPAATLAGVPVMNGHAASDGPAARPGAGTDAAFKAAVAEGDLQAALALLLDLDLSLEARLRSGEDSPELDEARAGYRAMLVRLTDAAGDLGAAGGESRGALAPVVETILDLRSQARAAGDFPTADRLRDRLTDAGIEVRDGAQGSEWSLSGSASGGEPR
jgi:hypothetical protein